MIILSKHSDGKGERRWHAGISLALMAFSLVGLTFTNNLVLSVICLCIAASGIYVFMSTFWALPTAVLGGGAAAVGFALINSVGNLGGFVGPYAFGLLADLTKSTVAGTYVVAAFVLIACVLVICVPKKYERAANVEAAVPASAGKD
jgi:ACS family tartrate transporter-like MFS transporter